MQLSFSEDWILSPEIMATQVHAVSWRRLYLSRAKLKAISRTSALLSGFAMVAMVEVQIDEKIPTELLIAFSVITTLLVSVHVLALMISTCILPNIEAVSNVHSFSAVQESPHDSMHWYIELAWALSTGLGILLFLAEIAILCWVKFVQYTKAAAIASTVIVLPVVIIFIGFSVHFYRKLVTHKYEKTNKSIAELETMATQLDSNQIHGQMMSV